MYSAIFIGFSSLENTEKNFNLKIRNILWYAYTIQLDIDNDMLDDEEIFDIIDYENQDGYHYGHS